MRQPSPMRTLQILACACGTVAALASLPAPARAVDYSWINPAGGFFGQPAFWTPFDPVPPPPIYLGPGGAADTVNFNLGVAPANRYTVVGVTGENDKLRIRNDSLRLEITDYELLSEGIPDVSLIVGVDDGDVADVILTGTGPAALHTQFGIIGSAVGSTGAVTVENLTWNHAKDLYVGDFGTGTLTIENGGTVTAGAGSVWVGYEEGSIGTIIVRGADANWNCLHTTIGRDGTGSLTIEDGGSAVSRDPDVGFFEGSSGMVTVRGVGSFWTTRLATISYQGEAQLNIEDSGSVYSARGWIGGWKNESFHPVDATVHVTGVGSHWTVEESDACNNCDGSMIVGVANRATLTIDGGGRVSNTDSWIGFQAESIGAVLVTGAGSEWTNDGELFVGDEGTGTLTIAGGGSVSNTTGWIAANAGSTGTVIVRGVRSKWTNDGELFVGNFGAGELTIDNGGEVSNNGVWIGTSPGSTGVATVRGTGSTWTSSGQFIVGYRAEGTMIVEAGGRVANDGDAFIGFTATTDSAATVRGARSTWTNTGGLVVGNSGTGTLLVESGARVSNTNGIVGNDIDSSGTVTVTGENSSWANSGTLIVGNSGAGTLNVQLGGVVSAVGGMTVGLRGRVEGDGTIVADVTNSGEFAPGNSPGTLNITGDYTQLPLDGELEIELASSISFDRLVVSGRASLRGTLDVALLGGFAPTLPGQTFTIVTANSLTGRFDEILGTPSAALPGMFWTVQYTSDAAILSTSALPGDINLDGSVNRRDSALFARHFGMAAGSIWTTGDFNSDGATTSADLAKLQSYLGQSVPRSPFAAAVPEPTSWIIALLGAFSAALATRRRRYAN